MGEFGLVMPFVNVTSVGGELDDLAFACGWDCGMLLIELQSWKSYMVGEPKARWVKPENVQQFDLIAMSEGFSIQSKVYENNSYVWMEFKKNEL